MTSNEFIAFDWCGWSGRYGRFTHMPSGKCLVCQAWMCQSDWNKAQLDWLKQLNGELVIHKCYDGPYRETGDTYGTVQEVIDRLQALV